MTTDTLELDRRAPVLRRRAIARAVLGLAMPALALTATVAISTPAHAGTMYPIARFDAFTVEPIGPTKLIVLANDYNPVSGTSAGLVITSVTQPSLGSVSIAPDRQSLLYIAPGHGVTTTSSTVLTYTIRNGNGAGLTPGLVSLILNRSAYATNIVNLHITAGPKVSLRSFDFGSVVTPTQITTLAKDECDGYSCNVRLYIDDNPTSIAEVFVHPSALTTPVLYWPTGLKGVHTLYVVGDLQQLQQSGVDASRVAYLSYFSFS